MNTQRDFLNGLNMEQFMAVTSKSKSILCLAGAGTGKTKTLTHRIAQLNKLGVRCRNMVALTFTRLAGKEMKERVIGLIGDEEGNKLFCNTFHSFCVKILKEFGHLIGLSDNFSIYDQKDRDQLLKEIMEELFIKVKMDDIIYCLKNEVEEDDIKLNEALQVANEYRYKLKRNNSIDLNLMIVDTLNLIKGNKSVQEDLNSRYSHMFVDEFQDSNDEQISLIQIINSENKMFVGDEDQSIYGWNNAKIDFILNINDYFPGTEVIKIEENYRSTREIIEASNTLIAHNLTSLGKVLETEKEGQPLEYHVLEDTEEEASYIAKRIMTYGREYRDFAILTRTNKQLETFKSIFKMYHLPFQLVAEKDRAFNGQEVKAVLSYAEVAINTLNDALVKKIINFPERIVSNLEISEIELSAMENDTSLYEALKESGNKKIKGFISIMESIIEKIDKTTKASLSYKAVLTATGMSAYYMKQGASGTTMNIVGVEKKIKEWEMGQISLGEDISIETFLKWLVTRELEEAEVVEDRNEVKLLTVHASKGLEFPICFVVGLNDTIFPDKRSPLEDERRLCYVAITRAKEHVILTRPKTIPASWGNKIIKTTESQFIKEAGVI